MTIFLFRHSDPPDGGEESRFEEEARAKARYSGKWSSGLSTRGGQVPRANNLTIKQYNNRFQILNH